MRPRRIISEEQFTGLVKTAASNRVRGGATGKPVRDGGTHVKSTGRTGGIPVAATNPAPSPFSPYANKWEFNHAKVLELELRAGAIKSWTYETITFRLAYRQYHRSDFVIGHNDRTVEIRQIKGWHPNLRASIKGLKWAAQKYPMFTWTIKWWTGTGWDGKYVEV